MPPTPDDRFLAAEAMLRTGALQNAIFNSVMFSKIATDASGVIQIFNAGAQHMLGYSAAEVVGRCTPADFADPGEIAVRMLEPGAQQGAGQHAGFDALAARARLGIEDIYELTCIRKDGRRIPVALSVTALRDADENIIGYLLIGSDNTARQQAERALLETNLKLGRAKAAAERANLAKSEFLSSMSHELRSPLNAILGFAQLMDTAEPPPSPGQQDSIDQVLRAGWFLLKLIDEILDLSLIESGRLSLSTESISLAELLNDVQAMIEPRAAQHHIALRFPEQTCSLFTRSGKASSRVGQGRQEPCEHRCAHFIHADRTRIKQVFLNLLSNAVKYNRPAGSVLVSCSIPSPGRIRVAVTDEGEGLSPQQVSQLFQPFNRLGRETGTEEGTGIGLVVSKRLVELMGGTIGVESRVGAGSTFWVELDSARPVEQQADMAEFISRPVPEPHAQAHRHTLLCVEDNPANLLLIEKLIARRPDIRLVTARDAERALLMVAQGRPDVILMDINLPGMSGLQAMSVLARNPETAAIPVVALSANAMAHDVQRALSAGFHSYLTKPLQVRSFMETLEQAIATAVARRAGHPGTAPAQASAC